MISNHRKLVIIGGIVAIVIVSIGLYGWWSVMSWNAVGNQTRTLQREVQGHLEKAAALPVSTADEKAKKLIAFEDIQQQIDSYKEMCNVSTLVEWQRLLDTAKKQQDTCLDTLAVFDTFKTSLKNITEYLRDDQELASLIISASASSGEDLDEASWQVVATKWHVLAEKTKSLQVSSRFEPVLKRIATEAAHMDASWQEVIAAHTVKDRVRYEKAKDELSKSYGTFKDAVQLSNDTIVPLQKEFQATYDVVTFN